MKISSCGIAYPGGVIGPTAYDLVQNYFLYGRGATNPVSTGLVDVDLKHPEKTNLFFLPANAINEEILKRIKLEGYLKSLQHQKRWCCLVFHEIIERHCKNPNPNDGILLENFQKIISFIKKYQLEVKTIREVIEEYCFTKYQPPTVQLLTGKEYANLLFGHQYAVVGLYLYHRIPFFKKLYSLLARKLS